MNQADLRPANDFAQQFGVKALVHGTTGTGKTPVANTAPRPVMLACEPGLLSMRGSGVPTWTAWDVKRIDEFFAWLSSSAETKNFDTVVIDSISQMSQIYLTEAEKKISHGLAAYGDMARKVYKHLSDLFFMKNKHTYLIAKQETLAGDIPYKRPWFPGKELSQSVPFLYDVILHLDYVPFPGHPEPLRCFLTQGSSVVMARDRSGRLGKYEPPDLAAVFAKCMS